MSADNPNTPSNISEALAYIMHNAMLGAAKSRNERYDTPLADALFRDVCALFPDKIRMKVYYSGSGDSGWFDCAPFFESVTDTPLSEEQQATGSAVVAKHNISKIYEELYKILESRAPGWEINEGSQGCFVFGPDGERKHLHDENITEINSNEWEF
jgi:hypothetical protein